MKMFSVYDSKAESYMMPFTAQSRGSAVRSFTEASNDPQSPCCKHPSDYTLFAVGEFDELTGVLTPYKANVSLGCAIEFKKDSPPAAMPLRSAN